jgi:hypothetical protein
MIIIMRMVGCLTMTCELTGCPVDLIFYELVDASLKVMCFSVQFLQGRCDVISQLEYGMAFYFAQTNTKL